MKLKALSREGCNTCICGCPAKSSARSPTKSAGMIDHRVAGNATAAGTGPGDLHLSTTFFTRMKLRAFMLQAEVRGALDVSPNSAIRTHSEDCTATSRIMTRYPEWASDLS